MPDRHSGEWRLVEMLECLFAGHNLQDMHSFTIRYFHSADLDSHTSGIISLPERWNIPDTCDT